jgi:hypothetical protein
MIVRLVCVVSKRTTGARSNLSWSHTVFLHGRELPIRQLLRNCVLIRWLRRSSSNAEKHWWFKLIFQTEQFFVDSVKNKRNGKKGLKFLIGWRNYAEEIRGSLYLIWRGSLREHDRRDQQEVEEESDIHTKKKTKEITWNHGYPPLSFRYTWLYLQFEQSNIVFY